MRIAVEGCAHGELNKIYETIKHIEMNEQTKVDLLICCGDFQSVRDHDDMISMAVPQKYMEMKDFWEYYTGKRTAPILTIFIGGNHEASSYLWELPYGGWVAENIYYLGYAGVVNFAGIRIGGISGIYKKRDYLKDHIEMPPFNEETKRSFYHVRKGDVEKFKLLKDHPPDICLSHDWPTNIYNHGDKEQLIRFKPYLKDEIESCTLGSIGAEELLNVLQPKYWFSGHMHAKFVALVEHSNGKRTKFLALDKCLPKRKFLQILDFGEAKGEGVLKYDLYWLGILKTTNELLTTKNLTEEHKPSEKMLNEFQNANRNFDVIPFSKSVDGKSLQTSTFCERFNLTNPCMVNSWKSIKKAVAKNEKDKIKQKMELPKPGTGDTTINKSFLSSRGYEDEDEFGDISNPTYSSNLDVANSSSSSNSSSSNSDDDDDDSSDSDDSDDSADKNSKTFNEREEFPSFIETPIAQSPNIKLGMTPLSVTSTPFKSKMNTSGLKNKVLSFIETPIIEKTSDNQLSSKPPFFETPIREKTINSDELRKEIPFQTPLYMDKKDFTSKDEDDTATLRNDVTPSPKKKFKLIRRNQSIYTPTKDEEF